MILHQFEQGVGRLAPEIILLSLRRKRIGFVDEQNAVERLFHSLTRFDRCRSDIAGDQLAAIDLDDMA